MSPAYRERHLSVGALKSLQLLLTAAGLTVLTVPALANAPAGKGAVAAIYATRAEAEKAARLQFNCTGAHRMGDHWMPCASHGPGQGSAHNH